MEEDFGVEFQLVQYNKIWVLVLFPANCMLIVVNIFSSSHVMPVILRFVKSHQLKLNMLSFFILTLNMLAEVRRPKKKQ